MRLMEGRFDEEIKKANPGGIDLAFGNPVRVPGRIFPGDRFDERCVCFRWDAIPQ